MARLDSTIAAVFLITVTVLMGLDARPADDILRCKEPADIVFLVDSSTSIETEDFNGPMKTFLKDIISTFDVGQGPEQTRIGMVMFSTNEHLEFHLNKYKSTADVLEAVDKIPRRWGDTYTHKALEFASNVMLTAEHGARDGVVKLLVVLTDGRSSLLSKTKKASKAIHEKGLDVIAIGVGSKVSDDELYIIGSKPHEKHVFFVNDYKALDTIKQRFQQSACESIQTTMPPTTSTTTMKTRPTTTTTTTTTTTPTTTTTTPTTTTTTPTTTTTTPTTTTTTPTTTTTTPTTTTTTPTTTTTTPTTTTTSTTTTTTPTTTTTTPKTTTRTSTTTTPTTTTRKQTITSEELPQGDIFQEECRGKPADIYFLLDASSSVWIYHFHTLVLPFVRDLVSSFHISPMHTRVGLVTFSNDINHEFNLSAHSNLQSLLDAIQPEHVDYLTGGTYTGDAIEYVVHRGFGVDDARQGVAQIIITITDGLSHIPTQTAKAAEDARNKGVYMFAVGVGDDVDEDELKAISSNPDEDFVFRVHDFNALSSITDLLAVKACKAVSNDQPPQLTECSTKGANIMFLYEYFNSVSYSKIVVEDIITRISLDAAALIPSVKIGTLTQPCIGGGSPLLASSRFQQALAEIHGSYSVGYTSLLSRVRTEIFQNVPADQNRVAVLVLDEMTKNLDLIEVEVEKLKRMNVKVVVVSVGKVKELHLEKIASAPSKENILRADSYSDLKKLKIDVVGLVCGSDVSHSLYGYNTDTSNTNVNVHGTVISSDVASPVAPATSFKHEVSVSVVNMNGERKEVEATTQEWFDFGVYPN